MGQIERAPYMDVSNTVDVTDTAAVRDAVACILNKRYSPKDIGLLEQLFDDCQRLYSGHYPGYRACDIRYHNHQHVLDVTLAMARLLEGHARSQTPQTQLPVELVQAGMAAAMFHDAGYIRKKHDTRHSNGAAYTRVHVRRSARFLAEYLPSVGLDYLVGTCTRIVYFTGYDTEPSALEVKNNEERLLGNLLGTADLIAQMADVDYLRKCRECLYEEFVAGGMAGEEGTDTHTGTIYRSPEQLLSMTPAFIRSAIEVRLDGEFNSVHRFAAEHFGGKHLYMDAIQKNCRLLEAMLSSGDTAPSAS
jgi:hypothetical protein